MQDEHLDIVNNDDMVIGSQWRSEAYKEKRSNFRVINGFIRNSKNQLWIPTRSAHKALFPLCLDASVGGHVQAGEPYEQAFIRELEEELNIKACDTNYTCLAHLQPHAHNVSAFTYVYEISTDITPSYNTDDFIDYEWLTPEELMYKITHGTPSRGDLIKLIHFAYHQSL
jgi:isopentenyl-diphosphate delta-isomerase